MSKIDLKYIENQVSNPSSYTDNIIKSLVSSLRESRAALQLLNSHISTIHGVTNITLGHVDCIYILEALASLDKTFDFGDTNDYK